jgi:hypothetical protein
LGNRPDRNTTDTVHTSSFEYRATLLFAFSADFDLVCRALVRSQIFRRIGRDDGEIDRHMRCRSAQAPLGKRADQAADHCAERDNRPRARRGDTPANGSQIS